MKEYIEREAAIKVVCDSSAHTCDLKNCFHGCQEAQAILAIPAADVVAVRHGRWIDDKVAFYLGCSECGCYLEYAVDTFLDGGDHYHYCPNCGARMDGDVE